MYACKKAYFPEPKEGQTLSMTDMSDYYICLEKDFMDIRNDNS